MTNYLWQCPTWTFAALSLMRSFYIQWTLNMLDVFFSSVYQKMTSTSAIRDKKFIILMAVLSLDALEVVIVNFQQNQRQKLCQKWWHFLFRNDSWQYPDSKSHGANMGHHLGPTGPRWAPCWPHEPYYLGICRILKLPRHILGLDSTLPSVAYYSAEKYEPSSGAWGEDIW